MDEQRATMAPGYEPWYIGWYVVIIDKMRAKRLHDYQWLASNVCYCNDVTLFVMRYV